MALVLPLFFVFVFGIIELSLLLKDDITVSRFTKDAARVASVMGNRTDTDYSVLQVIKASAVALPMSSIKWVVVFEGSASVDEPTASCKAGTASSTVGSRCNVYSRSQVQSLTKTDLGCGPSDPDRFWCPTSRSVSASNASFVGVYFAVRHTNLIAAFGSSRSLAYSTVYRIEPTLL